MNTPLYRSTINRDQRSIKALLNVASECFIEGVSAGEVCKIFNLFRVETITSTQASKTSKKLDERFAPWRNRDFGEFTYLVLDAGYEKLRLAGIVRDVAVLIAVGVDREGKRRILGVSLKLKDAELRWREFLGGLVHRGISGVEYIVPDDHLVLKAARRAVFRYSKWKRCLHHLTQDPIKQAPNEEIRGGLVTRLRIVYNAETLKPFAEYVASQPHY